MMKSLRHLLIATVLVAAPFFTAFAQLPDDGHVLTDLWKQYEKAADADLPQLEAELLQKIKTEAAGKHLPVDFYDAATAYVDARARRNWKEREGLQKALEAEIADFDEPIVTFLWLADYQYASSSKIYEFVEAHPDGFSGHNPAFYQRRLSQYLGGALPHFITGDREYVLWRLLAYRESGPLFDELYAAVGKRYPGSCALGYATLTRDAKRRPVALDSLIARYEGTAAVLYPMAERAHNRFSRLTKENAGSDAWKALYDDCVAIERQRLAFTGDEALIAKGCTDFANLCERLTEQDLTVSVIGGRAVVRFRNLKQASLDLRSEDSEKTLRSWKLSNPVGSFYARDSVSVAIPTLKDGEYSFSVKSGDCEDYCPYEQYTLSLAIRQDARGWSAYVADYMSGQPVTALPLTFHIKKNGKEIATVPYTGQGDFTLLPKELQKQFTEKQNIQYWVTADSRGSRPRYHNTRYYLDSGKEKAESATYSRIFRDRGAYHPGDTLHFKGLVYSGHPDKGYKVLANQKVEVNLFDSEYNPLEELELKTNAFGSVTGEFVLPKDARGGTFTLSLYLAGEEDALADSTFPVDAFVEPTYTLEFDRLEKLFLFGDTIPVSGRLTSYSGHPMSGASVLITVSRWGDLIAESPVTPDPASGAFTYSFEAGNEGYYRITARVTDATGETQSYETGVYVDSGVRLDASVLGTAPGEIRLKDESSRRYSYRPGTSLVLGDSLALSLRAVNSAGTPIPEYPVRYGLYRLEAKDTVLVSSGEIATGASLSLPLDKRSALYLVKCSAESRTQRGWHEVAERSLVVLRLGEGPLPERVRYVFAEPTLEDKGVRVRFGACDGPQWTVLAVYDKDKKLLYSDLIRTKDREAYNGLVPFKADWPDAVRVELFAFKAGAERSYGSSLSRPAASNSIPLSLIRRSGSGRPVTEYCFTLQTDPGAEVLVAVWDKSLEAIAANPWSSITLGRSLPPMITTLSALGRVTDDGKVDEGDMVILAYGDVKSNGAYVLREKAMVMTEEDAVEAEPAEVGAAMDVEERDEAASGNQLPSEQLPPLRSNFATLLTFQPQLRADKQGRLDFSFRTAGKLSTYIIGVFAHDKTMRNAVLKSDFLVTIPVRVALLEPRYLFSGDTYEEAVTLSSTAEEPVTGTLRIDTAFLSGMTESEPETGSFSQELTLAPGETKCVRVPVQALEVHPAFVGDRGTLTLTVRFITPTYSDGIELSVPVYPAAQTLTESHSAVLRGGMLRTALIAQLRDRFVNVPGSAATLKEQSVLDMVKEAIPTKLDPAGSDVLSLSEAWYVRLLSGKLLNQAFDTEELMQKILACRNADGGFGWFEGMESSPLITAVLLERMAKIRAQGLVEELPDLSDAVRYLDEWRFKMGYAWYYGLSDAQYLYVRALYAEVTMNYKPVGKEAERRWSEFKKETAEYLVPPKKRGFSGQILAKARRLLTLRALSGSKEGLALAKAWGISGGAAKLTASMEADLRSLEQYAVEHKDGGWYFPNAVLPWRGLLEGEAYAHALLCDLFAQAGKNELADGIRLWLMLQKETQQWDADPAFVDAIHSILAGSEAVLDTRVISLSATYTAPITEIQATGNGFTIERQLERLSGTEWLPIAEGDAVSVGDRIRAVYRIYSDENRSFVRIEAGREASLRPVEQLSGSFYGFLSRGYREVKADRTIFFFDRYPEEKTTLREEFFVQQAGAFVAPVVTVESCYAPHYRANDAFRAPLLVTAQ